MSWNTGGGEHFIAANPPNTYVYPAAPTGAGIFNGIAFAPPPSGDHTGAADTAALQALFNKLLGGPTGNGVPAMTVQLGAGEYEINASWIMYRKAIILRGLGVGNPPDYTANPGSGTTIRWAGTTNVAMLQVQDTRSVVIEDIYFQGNDTNPPLCAIEFFQGPADAIGVNRNMSIERCLFGYLPWTGTGGTKMTYCILIDGTNANNQMHYFRDCQFSRPVTAGVYMPNSQSIWCQFVGCSWDGNNTAKGLVTSAATTIFNGQFGQCLKDIEINGSAHVAVTGWFSENSKMFFDIVADGSLMIKGGVLSILANMQGLPQCAQALALTDNLTIEGVYFNYQITPKPPLVITGAAAGPAGPYTVRIAHCTNLSMAEMTLTGAPAPGSSYFDIETGAISMRRNLVGALTATDAIWTSPIIHQAPTLLIAQTAAQNLASVIAGVFNDGKKHLFRVGGTITITTLGSGNINLQVNYTDDNGTARTCFIPLCAEAGTFAASANTADAWKGGIVIAVNPNTAITVLTAGTFTGCTYNAGGYIERMN